VVNTMTLALGKALNRIQQSNDPASSNGMIQFANPMKQFANPLRIK
jgi:hypothetical protein